MVVVEPDGHVGRSLAGKSTCPRGGSSWGLSWASVLKRCSPVHWACSRPGWRWTLWTLGGWRSWRACGPSLNRAAGSRRPHPRTPEEQELSRWLSRQREFHSQGRLVAQRVEQLEAPGVPLLRAAHRCRRQGLGDGCGLLPELVELEYVRVLDIDAGGSQLADAEVAHLLRDEADDPGVNPLRRNLCLRQSGLQAAFVGSRGLHVGLTVSVGVGDYGDHGLQPAQISASSSVPSCPTALRHRVFSWRTQLRTVGVRYPRLEWGLIWL